MIKIESRESSTGVSAHLICSENFGCNSGKISRTAFHEIESSKIEECDVKAVQSVLNKKLSILWETANKDGFLSGVEFAKNELIDQPKAKTIRKR